LVGNNHSQQQLPTFEGVYGLAHQDVKEYFIDVKAFLGQSTMAFGKREG
jgi:hypothetical protein